MVKPLFAGLSRYQSCSIRCLCVHNQDYGHIRGIFAEGENPKPALSWGFVRSNILADCSRVHNQEYWSLVSGVGHTGDQDYLWHLMSFPRKPQNSKSCLKPPHLIRKNHIPVMAGSRWHLMKPQRRAEDGQRRRTVYPRANPMPPNNPRKGWAGTTAKPGAENPQPKGTLVKRITTIGAFAAIAALALSGCGPGLLRPWFSYSSILGMNTRRPLSWYRKPSCSP